jgi:protein-arginine kinase activator protein McsA
MSNFIKKNNKIYEVFERETSEIHFQDKLKRLQEQKQQEIESHKKRIAFIDDKIKVLQQQINELKGLK